MVADRLHQQVDPLAQRRVAARRLVGHLVGAHGEHPAAVVALVELGLHRVLGVRLALVPLDDRAGAADVGVGVLHPDLAVLRVDPVLLLGQIVLVHQPDRGRIADVHDLLARRGHLRRRRRRGLLLGFLAPEGSGGGTGGFSSDTSASRPLAARGARRLQNRRGTQAGRRDQDQGQGAAEQGRHALAGRRVSRGHARRPPSVSRGARSQRAHSPYRRIGSSTRVQLNAAMPTHERRPAARPAATGCSASNSAGRKAMTGRCHR